MLPSTVYCDTCGAANRPQARFCIACGQAMPVVSSLPPTVQTGSTLSSPTGRLASNSLLKQRYRILSQLGRGGMAAVYKAEDTQLGDRLVAVKEMSQSGLSSQEIIEAADAFKREAHLLAGLQHPNLPSIHDHFSEGGRWYLVMSFIEGETLADYLNKAQGGRLSVEEVFDIGIQLCTVLGYLHQHQPPIIFRDLKPANVMRTSNGHLYLIDFGIARHFKPGQSKDTAAYGSMGYAAPEQYGKAQTTPQSDIYSLGTTLHQLLSGNDPSQSPFIFAPLSSAAIPAGLGTLIMQLVQVEANKRPASMAEVKKELQHLATQPAGTQLSPTQYVGGAWLPPTQLAVNIPPAQPSLAVQRQSVPPKPMRAASPLGTVLCTYRGHSDWVRSVVWSPNGIRIASASSDKTVQVWDATTGQNLLTYHGHSDWVRSVVWSPDGAHIASAGGDQTVQVWDATTGQTLLTYRGHSDWVSTVAWSPDGTRIVSTSDDKTAQVWDATTGQTLLTYHGHSNWALTVAWSPDGTRIASQGSGVRVQVWDAATGKGLSTYRGHSRLLNSVKAVAWSPDGTRIASASDDETVQVWDAATGKNILTYRGHSNSVHSVAWSPDGTRIASASTDKTVQVWDAATGKNILTYRGHSNSVWSVAWSPDGTRIASASEDKTVQVWQAT